MRSVQRLICDSKSGFIFHIDRMLMPKVYVLDGLMMIKNKGVQRLVEECDC